MSDQSLIQKIREILGVSLDDGSSRLKILFRPDRWKYIKKEGSDLECPFCRASQKQKSFESLVVYKTEKSMILLNKYPYNSGHLLVVPHRHEGDFLSLSEDEYTDLHLTLKLAVQAAQSIYEPQGMNVGLNLGKAAGAGIPNHMHYHVIPRFNGDLNFFPLIAETKVISESLENCYSKYFEYFSKEDLI